MATSKKKASKTSPKSASAPAVKKDAAVPAELMADLMADANLGQENMDADDFAIPRISLLQQLSPQVVKGKPEYNEDFEVGDIYNTVSQEVHSGEAGINVVPITYRRAQIEWRLRKNGGGFVKDHGMDESVLDACNRDDDRRMINADGNQIVTTSEYFVYVVNEETGDFEPAVLSMTGMQLKKARRWNTLINNFKLTDPGSGKKFVPAMFYRVYHLTSVAESNDKGDWMGWEIRTNGSTVDLPDGVGIYSAAKEFRGKVASGDVKVSAEESPNSAKEDEDSPM